MYSRPGIISATRAARDLHPIKRPFVIQQPAINPPRRSQVNTWKELDEHIGSRRLGCFNKDSGALIGEIREDGKAWIASVKNPQYTTIGLFISEKHAQAAVVREVEFNAEPQRLSVLDDELQETKTFLGVDYGNLFYRLIRTLCQGEDPERAVNKALLRAEDGIEWQAPSELDKELEKRGVKPL